MELKIIVLAKQVPDTKNITGEAMKPDGTVNRAALPAIFNPEDLNALETAIELKQKYGGKVIVITMGPPSASEILRQAFYRGADEAYLISDRRFAGADTLATSYTLMKAIESKVPDYDIICCGRQAIDGDTAQVGPQVAEKLNIPQITYVASVENVSENSIKVKKHIQNGEEILESTLPVLLTVVGDANTPRPANSKLLMKYKLAGTVFDIEKNREDWLPGFWADWDYQTWLEDRGLLIPVWNADDIKTEENKIGLNGSPTKVKKVQNIVLTGEGYKAFEPTSESIRKMIDELKEDHTLG